MNPPVIYKPLPLMESFYSMQGEGAYSGSAAYFLRLGGCDVGCFWCDVKDSWDMEAHPKVEVSQMVELCQKSGTEVVIITGGEPLMHNLDELTEALQDAGLKTHLETSGVHPLTGSWDWICFPPKKFKAPLPGIYDQADELKIVVYNKHDLRWAEEHGGKVNNECKLYLQPEWDRRDVSEPMILNYIRQNPKWRLSIQSHKYLGIP
jgi:organic radical activating enzyme